jgi:hypothetical protein
MSFAHITRVATRFPTTRAVWIYDARGEESVWVGFRDTREVLAFISSDSREVFKILGEVEVACLGGEWEVDDAGSTFEFDGHEVYPGDTWAQFKQDHVEYLEETEVLKHQWRREIAMEEGMLNGIDSYNDWMGY